MALIATLALVAFVGAGIAGNPWYRLVTIEGGSMAPAISRGDLIVVVTPAPRRSMPGMILVMTVGGEVVTHRVVAVNADGTFVTRGDANGVDDNWGGQQAKVIGQYLATVPMLGRFLPVGTASEASFADASERRHADHCRPVPDARRAAHPARVRRHDVLPGHRRHGRERHDPGR